MNDLKKKKNSFKKKGHPPSMKENQKGMITKVKKLVVVVHVDQL